MSYELFKPTLWSKAILFELEKKNVFKATCDYTFQGEAREGKELKILGVGDITLHDYVPGTPLPDPQIVEGVEQIIKIDQAKSFNYVIDNIDKYQSVDSLSSALRERSTRKISNNIDAFIAKECAIGAHEDNIIASSAISTPAEAKEVIDELFVKLWSNDVPLDDDIDIFIKPWFYTLFKNEITNINTNNVALLGSGILGMYNGAVVKMTNNIYNDGTDDNIIVKTRKGYAFA
ncbi:MAG: hypothetical protein IJX61_04540, partial [Ruminococcus sp.]|nr:hypothetical protein [Ruminococcus sp.]